MPVYEYKVRTKDGVRDKAFNIREFQTNECPVSILSKCSTPSDKPNYITGQRAAELVRMWMRARRNKKTLSQMLGSNAAWIEDVEDALADVQATVDQAQRNALENRIT